MNIRRLTRLLTPVFLLAFVRIEAAEVSGMPSGPSIIGIDHMPTAVRDLDQASDAYRQLGFSLKPGRFHENGIQNNHVKFRDGSGIELLAPPSESTDALTAHYLDHLNQGDGPAYISFHAREKDELISALDSSGFKFKDDGLIILDDPRLGFIFFVQDNRSPTDKPEHFAHPNSAVAMTGVWLALDDASRASLTRLLVALGAVTSSETIFIPNPVEAKVFTVQNGRIVALPKSHQLHDGRPVVGAEFCIRDVKPAARYLGTLDIPPKTPGDRQRYLVPPPVAHGLWLEFHE